MNYYSEIRQNFIIKVIKTNWQALLAIGFLYGAPIIDNFLGAQMRSTGEDGALGKIYRVIYIAVLLFGLLTNKIPKKIFSRLVFFLLWIFCLPLIYTISDSNASGLFADYAQLMKLAYPIILYTVLSLFIKNGKIKRKQIENVIIYYILFYPLSLIVPYILGIGYQSYAIYDAGYSGFYGAGNELSIVLVCMYILSLDKFLNGKKRVYLGATCLNAFSAILTGSKTGMIVLVVATVMLAVYKKKAKEIVESTLVLVACVGIALIFFGGTVGEILQSNLQMIENKSEQMNTSWLTFVLSARNLKIIPNIEAAILDSPDGFKNFVLGRGYYRQVTLSGSTIYSAASGLIEMDWFDVFFQHGVVVLIYLAVFYLKRIVKKCDSTRWIYKFSAAIMLAFSTLAGHTLQSTLPATTLIIVLILLNSDERSKEEV